MKIIKAKDDKFNRKILEQKKADILLSPEKESGKDKIKKLDSGLNHILAKIATKNKTAIGIDLKEIKKLSKIQKAVRLSKIIQNIKTCRKAKTRLAIKGNKIESQNFLLSLGASTLQVKGAIYF